jgi:16S rRNA (guanine527-N7)-methyltransferase
MTKEEFQVVAGLSNAVVERLAIYAGLLQKWQRAINLVGPSTLADLWHRHMWDSAQLLPHLPRPDAVVLDLGSGAGFPGLVLAIASPATVHLVESDQRKAMFLNEVNRATQAGATVHACRVEVLDPVPVDVVTARAFAPLDRLLACAEPFFRPTTIGLFLKGRTLERELTACRKRWNMTAKAIPSLSDEAGVVLKLEGISRRHE